MYTLQGIITPQHVLEHDRILGATIVALPQNMVLIPFAGRWIDIRQIPLLPLTDEGGGELPTSIATLCRRWSRQGRLAYVEAEFFGGQGTQACSLWEKGKMVSVAQQDIHAINTALQFLGVEKGTSLDEFEALNLDRFRDTQAWLSDGSN